eukprot:g27805.t1
MTLHSRPAELEEVVERGSSGKVLVLVLVLTLHSRPAAEQEEVVERGSSGKVLVLVLVLTLYSRPAAEQEEVVESFNDVIPDPEATAPTVFRVPTRQAQADQQRTQPPPPPAKTVQMPPGAPPLLSQQQAKTVSMPPGAPPLLSQHQKAHPSKFKVAEAPPPQSLLTPSNK